LTAWASPSAPTPTTATDAPGRKPAGLGSRAARSRLWVTAKISVSTATSSGSDSGTRNAAVPGFRYRYSDQPPNRCGAGSLESELP
jgi:hypothetical protein